jgi:hypothetical protein
MDLMQGIMYAWRYRGELYLYAVLKVTYLVGTKASTKLHHQAWGGRWEVTDPSSP